MSRRARARGVAAWLLAAVFAAAGVSHLTWGRRGYRIVVPAWAPRATGLDVDGIVVASGAAELVLAAGLAGLPAERRRVGAAAALFLLAVWPGNVHQWRTRRSAPLLRTDRARLVRVLLQPLLVAWALWSTGRPGGR